MSQKRVLASEPGATQKSAAMTEGDFVLPEDARIDRSSPIPDQVYRLLRQAIITLRMPPGHSFASFIPTIVSSCLRLMPMRSECRM